MSEPTLESILAALTLEEKASLCDGADFWSTREITRIGVPSVALADGPHGLRKQAGDYGLPGSLPATCFPPAVALASSWSVDTVYEVGSAIADEAAAADVDVVLGPGVNIKRSPLCGRNFEYFSEDPVLAGELGASMVRGMQERGVGASVKHFAANNQETARMQVSAQVSERALREIYLPAFERVVTGAQPWTVMCAYNRVNGTYASEHPWLLTTVLRDEWGFDGVVLSDWGAVHDRVAGLRAGLDLEMPGVGPVNARYIVEAVERGDLPEADLDRTVRRLLRLALRRRPAARAAGDGAPAALPTVDPDHQHDVAHRAALESAVLLKNDGGLLPLSPERGGPLALIGTFAAHPRYQGVGSSQVVPTMVDDALSAVRLIVDGRREVAYAPGWGDAGDGEDDGEVQEALMAQAVTLAAAAQEAVVFLGLPDAAEAEAYDRAHLDLPARQLEVLRAVLAVNPKVAVVLSHGAPVETRSWDGQVPAVLDGWLLGQAGGRALADLLLGRANPSGKLAETVPLRLEDTPAFLSFPGDGQTVEYTDDVFVGYRWYDARRAEVAYPFGHGLSYTTFGYSALTVEVRDAGEALVVDVTCEVANTGALAGAEVVQLYVRDVESEVARPVRELKAFAKVALDAGESTGVAFTLTARDFAYFHPVLRRWVVEGGSFELGVGSSSRDLRLMGTVELAGEPLVRPLDPTGSVEEWLAHPVVGRQLRALLLDDGGYLASAEMYEAFRTASIVNLARYADSPFDEDDLQTWLAASVPDAGRADRREGVDRVRGHGAYGSQWWRDAVIYQVYPRSFADADGDGVGDLPGITGRLGHLAELGVDAVWLSPFYTSPQVDAGYDVADYRDVDPLFGTLADFDALVARARDLGMRVVVDLVPNHSSDRHAWFQEALAAPAGSASRARYIFRDGRGPDGSQPPNNWRSVFGGPAWTRTVGPDGRPGQWYLHLFDRTQPDFDWDNPEVRAEFEDVLRFWLDRGVAGFRVDVAHALVKAAGLPDHDQPEAGGALGQEEVGEDGPMWDQEGVHEIYRSWHRVLAEYGGDRMLVAEAWAKPLSRVARYVRPDEMSQAFNFTFLAARWDARQWRAVVEASLDVNDEVGAPTTWVLSNHDVVRHASAFGLADPGRRPAGIGADDPQPDALLGLRRARAATLLMLALPGSAYLYQGEELGLPEHTTLPDAVRQDPQHLRTGGAQAGRDGCRVPLPWEQGAPSFGFSPSGRSWLPQPEQWAELAADAQVGRPGSTLELYREALRRRRELGLGRGSLTWAEQAVLAANPQAAADCVIAFENGAVLAVANLGPDPITLPSGWEVLLTSIPLPAVPGQPASLPADVAAWAAVRPS